MNQPKNNKDLARGDNIIARNDSLGYYFSARVSKVLDSQYASIKFKDGTRNSNISIKNLIKLTDTFSPILVGDHVMAKVRNEFGSSCWVPGVIQLADNYATKKYFVVLYFNGSEGDNLRSELIKISREKYSEILKYIRSILSDDNIALKPFKEPRKENKPKSRSGSPPDMDQIKTLIVSDIKNHLNSLKINEKYDKMFFELSGIKKSQLNLKDEMNGKLKLLRQDFEEWKKQEPPILKPNPNTYIFIKNKKSQKKNLVQGIVSETKSNVSNEIELQPEPNLINQQKILQLRSELPQIKIGEKVLARWPDDGWYYRSIVTDYFKDSNQYYVDVCLWDCKIFDREDLISDISKPSLDLEVDDYVVAKHPEYEQGYAPGQVFHVSNDLKTYHVRFYDYVEDIVDNTEVFKIPRIKFQSDMKEILSLEAKWKDEEVIARNENKRVYESGTVLCKIDSGQQYEIQWPDGTKSIQNANHIFGKYIRKKSKYYLDYILAPRGEIYLPGRITAQRGDKFIVRYFDDSLCEDVDIKKCYMLTKCYYEDAIKFCKNQIIIYKDLDDYNLITSNKSSYDISFGRKTPVVSATDFFTDKPNIIIKRNKITN